VHTHRHFHVTHNQQRDDWGFEHLSAAHEHEHDHAPLHHTRVPHHDFDREHVGEAHGHDHDQPAAPGQRA
jgi:hypothetical protein